MHCLIVKNVFEVPRLAGIFKEAQGVRIALRPSKIEKWGSFKLAALQSWRLNPFIQKIHEIAIFGLRPLYGKI